MNYFYNEHKLIIECPSFVPMNTQSNCEEFSYQNIERRANKPHDANMIICMLQDLMCVVYEQVVTFMPLMDDVLLSYHSFLARQCSYL